MASPAASSAPSKAPISGRPVPISERLIPFGIGILALWPAFKILRAAVTSPVDFIKQVIEGIALGGVYALIALGYTMVYGVLGLINFAHSDVFMMGAYMGIYSAAWFGFNAAAGHGSIGLAASRSDAGVGVQVARAAAAGAYQNVCINLPGLTDKPRGAALLKRADAAWERAQKLHREAETEILGGLRAAAG